MIVTSKHRLPHPYRALLVILWGLPAVMLGTVLLLAHGPVQTVLNPLFWLPLLVMVLPALYVWHEGVDVTERGLYIRMQGWRYCPFDHLAGWHLHQNHGVLRVWDDTPRRVIDCHAAHLTDLPCLLHTLKTHTHYRPWME